jgi:hypothetical protein
MVKLAGCRLAEESGGLQMMLINRFCIFFHNKTVNYHMQAASEQAV